jgi:hypothetical protein
VLGVLAPEVLADPIRVVVDLVLEREQGLDRATVTGVVQGVAGGRAKRRSLAQSLLDRPRVLDDGRSPAPRAVGDLLVALNKAGASHISAPVCAECGKHLRTLQRRGDEWYCGVAVQSANPAAGADESARSTRGTATDNHAAWRVRPTAGVTRSSSRST